MNPKDESVRERLLSQLPTPANAAEYRKEVNALVAKNDRAIRWEKVVTQVGWIVCIAIAIGFLWFDGNAAATPKGPWLACFTFLVGMTELLKHHTNRCRIELLKEIKQVQLQVLDLRDAASPTSP
jgi:hypothetical protein